MIQPLREWIQSLLLPGYLLTLAIIQYLSVCYDTVIKERQILAPILKSSSIRDEAFGRLWVKVTDPVNQPSPPPQPKTGEHETTTPTQSADLIPPILSKASGIVLDIGPGTGSQMPFLRSPAIKAIYGPEPCKGLHAALADRIHEYALDGKYHILSCSAEIDELLPTLEREEKDSSFGLVVRQRQQQQRTHDNTTINTSGSKSGGGNTGGIVGIFDTIICVRVLCSVPRPQQTVDDLYSLLKPGGKMLITEHVVNPWSTPNGSIVARTMQFVYECLGWRWVMGNCCLSRDTESVLRKAAEKDGGWGVVELERSFEGAVLTYVSGVLVKRDLEREQKKER